MLFDIEFKALWAALDTSFSKSSADFFKLSKSLKADPDSNCNWIDNA